MNLPERYLPVTCIPKYSESKLYGIFDTVKKEIHVFTEKEGVHIWEKSEIKESFESFLNPEDGFEYDLAKVLK